MQYELIVQVYNKDTQGTQKYTRNTKVHKVSYGTQGTQRYIRYPKVHIVPKSTQGTQRYTRYPRVSKSKDI